MRTSRAALLALVVVIVTYGTAQARDFLAPGDIARADTSQAIITVSTPDRPHHVKAIRFPTVPDLQSCFSLAYTAVVKTHGESSATCINQRGVVAATYFCRAGDHSPQCEVVNP
jgi:hypothetical protein